MKMWTLRSIRKRTLNLSYSSAVGCCRHVSLYKVQASKIRATYIFTRFILWYCKPVYGNRNRLARLEPFIIHITHYTKHYLKSLRM